MQAITYLSDYKTLPAPKIHKNVFSRLLDWLVKEEKNHIAWVGISITVMSAVFFPITMSAILYNGAIFSLIMTAMVALAIVVIANLAALPTKYTIPALVLGVLIDIAAVIFSFLLR